MSTGSTCSKRPAGLTALTLSIARPPARLRCGALTQGHFAPCTEAGPRGDPQAKADVLRRAPLFLFLPGAGLLSVRAAAT